MARRYDRSRLPFLRALRLCGFEPDFTDKDCRQYVKTVGDREIDVQLWFDGKHRASHMLAGRGSTPPTPFTTVTEMHAAIETELTRTDHKPRT